MVKKRTPPGPNKPAKAEPPPRKGGAGGNAGAKLRPTSFSFEQPADGTTNVQFAGIPASIIIWGTIVRASPPTSLGYAIDGGNLTAIPIPPDPGAQMPWTWTQTVPAAGCPAAICWMSITVSGWTPNGVEADTHNIQRTQ